LVRVDGLGFDTGDLWTVELATGALSRVTTNKASYRGQWSRDGKRIVYLTGGMTTSRVMSRPWDGSGTDSVLLESPGIAEFSEGIAGGWSAIRTFSPRDIMILPTDSLRPAALRPFLTTGTDEAEIAISPSGRLIAYNSQETGNREVYVRPLPGPGPRVLVSLEGGVLPEWSSDGRTLYYMRPDETLASSTLMAATIATEPTLAVVKRDSLFSIPVVTGANPSRIYTALPGSRQFLLATTSNTRAPTRYRIAVITGWQALLEPPQAAKR
jgi:serine/threonine-protein kinase